MRNWIVGSVIVGAFVLGGSALSEQIGSARWQEPAPRPCERKCLTAIEAVTFASYVGERGGIAGEFEMPVRNVGRLGEYFFLNSEEDYRDRNCLTIAIPVRIAEKLTGSAQEAEVAKFFEDRRIVANGIARQVRIDFFDPQRRPTGKYYFQVHVQVTDPGQITLLT